MSNTIFQLITAISIMALVLVLVILIIYRIIEIYIANKSIKEEKDFSFKYNFKGFKNKKEKQAIEAANKSIEDTFKQLESSAVEEFFDKYNPVTVKTEK
jgi:hypothetical protein